MTTQGFEEYIWKSTRGIGTVNFNYLQLALGAEDKTNEADEIFAERIEKFISGWLSAEPDIKLIIARQIVARYGNEYDEAKLIIGITKAVNSLNSVLSDEGEIYLKNALEYAKSQKQYPYEPGKNPEEIAPWLFTENNEGEM